VRVSHTPWFEQLAASFVPATVSAALRLNVPLNTWPGEMSGLRAIDGVRGGSEQEEGEGESERGREREKKRKRRERGRGSRA
jgi:hypothetical protein|tara:strand:+ start:1313 stop:1558 length:246 start_codon:yes stop_codon:yes gene_type:complete